MRTFRRVLLGIVMGLLLGRLSAFGAPYDIVPRDDWTYDILARWAALGVLEKVAGRSGAGPAFPLTARELHGDEPLTRAEMAHVVLTVAERPEALPAGDEALLTHLLWEFSCEIKHAGGDPAALIRSLTAVKQPVLRATGFGLGRLGITGGDTLRGVYRAAGIASVTPRLLTAVSLTNERQLYSTDGDAFPILENYVARWHTGFAEWELGKTGRRWGPGFGGSMLLSDNAPALFQLRGLKHLSLGFLGRDYTFEQFIATLNEIGGRRYIVARRLSRPFGRRAGISIDEAIKSSSTRDWPLALFVPLYVYNHTAFTDAEKARTVNYLGGGDLWYAPSDAVRLYGDLVIDDITTPFGLGYHVPRKIGYLLGINLPHLNSRRTEVWLEWALTDGEQPGSTVQEGGTYIHRNPTLSWYVNDLPIGHPMGQNRRGPFARVRHRFSRRFTAIGEWEDEGQWRPTPVVGDRRRAMLYGAYDLRPDRSVALRVERTGGALGRDTLVEMQGSYSF